MFEGELGVPKSEHRVALQQIESLQATLKLANKTMESAGKKIDSLRAQLDQEQERNETHTAEAEISDALLKDAQTKLTQERQKNEDAMHKETAMCLELEQVRGQLDREQMRVRYLIRKNDEQAAEIVRVKAHLCEERKIGNWMVEHRAIRSKSAEHDLLKYVVGSKIRDWRSVDITNGDWRKAVKGLWMSEAMCEHCGSSGVIGLKCGCPNQLRSGIEDLKAQLTLERCCVDFAANKPHIMIPGSGGKVHVVPESVFLDIRDGRLSASYVDDFNDMLPAIISGWLEFLQLEAG